MKEEKNTGKIKDLGIRHRSKAEIEQDFKRLDKIRVRLKEFIEKDDEARKYYSSFFSVK